MQCRTKEEATHKAKLLADKLIKKLGGKWKIRVHYNMGWYFGVYLGTISVSAHW